MFFRPLVLKAQSCWHVTLLKDLTGLNIETANLIYDLPSMLIGGNSLKGINSRGLTNKANHSVIDGVVRNKDAINVDLNIGKNRENFNKDLNNRINEKPKNIRDEQVKNRVADLAYQFNTKSMEPKDMKLEINGKTYTTNPETSTGVPVFKNVSDQDVMSYFKELAGVDKLPVPKDVSKMKDLNGQSGKVWSVKPISGPLKDSTVNLRNFSSSQADSNAKYTIEIIQGRDMKDKVFQNKKIEIKFEK